MKKKTLIILFGLVFLALLSTTNIKAEGGNPLNAIWNAINSLQQEVADLWNSNANLQNQIENIELIPGPTGEPGPQGELGPAGSFNTYRVTSPIVFVNIASTANTRALCEPGDKIMSGGFFANGSTLQITQSRPELVTSTPGVQGWFVEGSTANPPAGILPGIGDIAAFALCNDVTP